MNKQVTSVHPSAKIPQAMPAWILVLPVQTVLCLTHNGTMQWAEQPRPQSTAVCKGLLQVPRGAVFHLPLKSNPSQDCPRVSDAKSYVGTIFSLVPG